MRFVMDMLKAQLSHFLTLETSHMTFVCSYP